MKKLSQRILEHLDISEAGSKSGFKYLVPIKQASDSVGGTKTRRYMMSRGMKTGVASALFAGMVGISFLIKKARQDGAQKTKSSIRSAMYKARKNPNISQSQKATVEKTGRTAIETIDRHFKTPKHESLSSSVMNKLDIIIEKANEPGNSGVAGLAGAGIGAATAAGKGMGKLVKRGALGGAAALGLYGINKIKQQELKRRGLQNRANESLSKRILHNLGQK